MRTCSFLSILVFLVIGGCEGGNESRSADAASRRKAIVRKIAVSEAAGESMLMVGGEAITSGQIIKVPVEHSETAVSLAEYLKPIAKTSSLEEFREQARPQVEEVLMGKISEILLYQEAKRQAGENIDETLEKAAEKEVRRFILDCGGDEAKAEEKLRQMGTDRKSFKENRKRFILSQWHIASKLPENKPITHSELVKCYNQIKEQSLAMPARLQFRLIDIQLARLHIVDPNQGQLEHARGLANELLGQIQAGEDFAELAKKYSHGHRREFGGLWQPIQPESLAEPYDVLAVEAEKIEPGQIAGPIETEGHIFIMKLEDKRSKSYELFEKVQTELEQKIIFERRKKVLEKLNAELMQQVDLNEKDEFIDFCLDKIYRMSNQ